MEYLALEVRIIHDIAVGCPDIADPGCGKVKERRTPKTPQADNKYPAFEQLQLARFPDFRNKNVPAVNLPLYFT
jgi:hypothetical protein